MHVTFTKTTPTGYGVYVRRDRAPDMVAFGAPGHGALPHDLLRFVAEAVWELDGGVFAGLATTVDPGVFYPADRKLMAKMLRERRPRPQGQRCDLLAAVLDAAWRTQRGAPPPEDWPERLAAAEADDERLERALGWLDELGERWLALAVGESLTLAWPGDRSLVRAT